LIPRSGLCLYGGLLLSYAWRTSSQRESLPRACSETRDCTCLLPLFVFRRHPEAKLKDPLMQSAMQMFVARFASKDPRIGGGTNAGVLQLRFRMTTKNKCNNKYADPLDTR
jgi:hypothetical protein